jgi:hypothetical protein
VPWFFFIIMQVRQRALGESGKCIIVRSMRFAKPCSRVGNGGRHMTILIVIQTASELWASLGDRAGESKALQDFSVVNVPATKRLPYGKGRGVA